MTSCLLRHRILLSFGTVSVLAHLVVSLGSLPVSLNEGLDLVVLILRVEQVLLEVGHRPLHGLLQNPGLVLVKVVHLLGGL